MDDAPVTLHHRIEPEDQARADFYALLARLFADAPDRALLAAIAAAPPLAPATILDPEAALPAERLSNAWDALRTGSAVVDEDVARIEYDALFVGTGKSEIDLHASHWIGGVATERTLVDVRAAFAQMDLGREPGASLYEDHLSALLEVMRVLVAGRDERPPADIAEQRSFFARFVGPWSERCCDAITSHGLANYYRRVGEFGAAFLAIERDALALDA